MARRFAGLLAVLAALGGLAGCSGSSGPATQSRFLPTPPPGSLQVPDTTQARIATALARHQIDYGTSLRYRLQALDGSDALPTSYHAAITLSDDPTLPAEATDTSLDGTTRAALAPYVSLPDDPASVFSGPAAVQTAAVVPDAHLADAPVCGPDGWAEMDSTIHPYGFHAFSRCTGTYAHDLAATVTAMDALYDPMTNLMGPPAAPSGVSDGGILIFLLSPGEYASKDGATHHIIPGAVAQSMPAAPFNGRKSSGFVELGRDLLHSPAQFASDLAHEFFHVLEDAHNRTLAVHRSNGMTVPDWFWEASAVWAEFHFAPAARPLTVYPRFENSFSLSDLSLLAAGPLGSAESAHMYGSFVWPVFLEQQLGSAVMGKIWTQLEGAANAADETHILDQALGFSAHYHDFAVQALDIAGLPSPRFQDLDPGFPAVEPRLELDATIQQQPPGLPPEYSFRDFGLAPLAAHYLHLRLEPGTAQLDVDLRALSPAGAWDLDALVHRGNAWQRVGGLRGSAAVCDTSGINEIYLVLANHSTSDEVDGAVGLKATTTPCGGSTQSPRAAPDGVITYTEKGSGVTSDGYRITKDITLTVHLHRAGSTYAGSWTLAGTDDEVSPQGCNDSLGTSLQTWSGSGTLAGRDVNPYNQDPELFFGDSNRHPGLRLALPATFTIGAAVECPAAAGPAQPPAPLTFMTAGMVGTYLPPFPDQTTCVMDWTDTKDGITYHSSGSLAC